MFSAPILTTIVCMGIVFSFGIVVGVEIERCRALVRQMNAATEMRLRLFTGRTM